MHWYEDSCAFQCQSLVTFHLLAAFVMMPMMMLSQTAFLASIQI
jgi:hypothetical protein